MARCIRPFLAVLAFALLSAHGAGEPAAQAPLNRIRQVLELTAEQAALRLPVEVSGVVTYGSYPAKGPWMMFVQDETAGIFVSGGGQHVPVGQRVLLRGVTDPGEFAPRIRRTGVKILGPAPLPAAELKTYADLVSGREDCQWVEVRGIVRTARYVADRRQLVLDLASGSDRFVAKLLLDHEPLQPWTRLVDAEVRVRGVCTALFNRRRQLLGVEIYAPGLAQLIVDVPAETDPECVPAVGIRNLMRFSRDGRAGHRVRVNGVVTYQEPGRFVYLRGADGAVFAQVAAGVATRVGDRVEVLGFPASGDFSAVLQDATVRGLGHEAVPAARRVNVARVLNGQEDADLIEINGRLLEHGRMLQQEILTIQADNLVFTALLHQAEFPRDALRTGSLLRLTGICAMPPGSQLAQPKSFRLLLRSPADVVEIEKPSWWSLRHTLEVLGGAVVVALLAFVWVVVVSRQNRLLREHRKVQQEILEISAREQRRIGQDLHDGICQQLGAIGFLSKMLEEELATDSPRHAVLAGNISRHLKEATDQTRAVAKGLFPVQLEENGLESALEELAAQTSRIFKVDCRFVCREPARIRDNNVALDLYYVASEAVNNAVRHAKPGRIAIELERGATALALTIRNDGERFVSAEASDRGMGLQIMRYRARRIGGAFAIGSDVAGGCVVSCTLAAPVMPG